MEHYITKIHIKQLRHLQNIDIELNQDKRTHLILTGKNGSGKTSLINALKRTISSFKRTGRREIMDPDYLDSITGGGLSAGSHGNDYVNLLDDKYETSEIELYYSSCNDLKSCYEKGKYIMACYPANRLTHFIAQDGVEYVKLNDVYTINETPVAELLQYLVHLKTQQIYAKNENDIEVEHKIADWFSNFESAIQELMDDESIILKYDYKNYNFLIQQKGRKPFGLNQLADGFSAAIFIFADILMRMDRNWLLNNTVQENTIEGLVLIDEIETHLHLELQKRILPFLTKMFPNIQFVVTTHSPFVVTSMEDVVIYDLENRILVKNGLSNVSYEGAVEGYFRVDALSNVLKDKFIRYKDLVKKNYLTDDEYDEILGLEQYLDEIPDYLSIGIAEKYARLKLEFHVREERQ